MQIVTHCKNSLTHMPIKQRDSFVNTSQMPNTRTLFSECLMHRQFFSATIWKCPSHAITFWVNWKTVSKFKMFKRISNGSLSVCICDYDSNHIVHSENPQINSHRSIESDKTCTFSIGRFRFNSNRTKSIGMRLHIFTVCVTKWVKIVLTMVFVVQLVSPSLNQAKESECFFKLLPTFVCGV